MKCLFNVIFALFFVNSFAFGQSNEATVDEYGENQYAEIDQIGCGNNADAQKGEIGFPISDYARFIGRCIRGAYI